VLTLRLELLKAVKKSFRIQIHSIVSCTQDVAPGAHQPNIDLALKRENGGAASARRPMDGKPVHRLPSLHGTNSAANVLSDLFPRLQSSTVHTSSVLRAVDEFSTLVHQSRRILP
jgi:hypothetical protein